MCSRAQVSLLKIREKELQFYTQNCIAIGTQAALLSGFAYNGIIQVDIPEESSDVLKALYLCVTTAAMGFELIAVLNSTLCSMLGPGLALRGPDGSMHRAVDGLMLEWAARPPPRPSSRPAHPIPRPPPGPTSARPTWSHPTQRRTLRAQVPADLRLLHDGPRGLPHLRTALCVARVQQSSRPHTPPGLPRLPPSAPASQGCFTGRGRAAHSGRAAAPPRAPREAAVRP